MEELRKIVQGTLLENEPMSNHTSYGIGGPAGAYITPKDRCDLAEILKFAKKYSIETHFVGSGSNLLVADSGIDGIVLTPAKSLTQLEFNDGHVIAESGVMLGRLVKECIKRNLTGVESMIGVPGTLGGALVMNAGAFGHETWDRVISVNVINRKGEILKRDPTQYKVEYRNVKGPQNEWFIGALLEFRSDKTSSTEKQKEMLDLRKHTQPLGKASCGSVFRNPPDSFAARLIEQSNLKGYKIERYDFPNLRAINFYIHGLLGEGVSSSHRIDKQAKSLGEYLRAKLIDFPIDLQGEV